MPAVPAHPSTGDGSSAPSGSLADRLFAAFQVLLPHHLLSCLAGMVSKSRARWIKGPAIALFRRIFRIDLGEAAEPDPRAYPSFYAFFTRPFRPGARPILAGDGEAACPVDGTVSQAGEIDGTRLLQAKGRRYDLAALLGGPSAGAGGTERAAPFAGGAFATLYLAPRDYHRIHMPLDGRLRETVHVPGRLFAVNPRTTRTLPDLFSRNERLAAIFDTEAGRMAVVLVGALLVGSIETVWGGPLAPPHTRELRVRDYGGDDAEVVLLERGQELGRFAMGSTVIVVFERGRIAWDAGVVPGATVRMGSRLGRVR